MPRKPFIDCRSGPDRFVAQDVLGGKLISVTLSAWSYFARPGWMDSSPQRTGAIGFPLTRHPFVPWGGRARSLSRLAMADAVP